MKKTEELEIVNEAMEIVNAAIEIAATSLEILGVRDGSVYKS